MAARKSSRKLQDLARQVGSVESDLAFLRELLARVSAMIEDPNTSAAVVVQLNFEALRVLAMVQSLRSDDLAPKTRDLISSLRVVK